MRITRISMKEKIIVDLLSLSQMYPLVLGNLGAGNSTMKAVFDGLFTRVMLDKSFIQQQITHRPSNRLFVRSRRKFPLVAIASSRGALIRQKYWHRLSPLISMLSRDACGLRFL